MIVVDAGLVIASLLPEANSEAARSLIASEPCVAPDLMVNECVNAIWKNVRLGRILLEEAELALEALPHLGIALVSSQPLADRAFALATGLEHPAYDCFYLALAERRGLVMVTPDEKFVRKVSRSGISTAEARLLIPETMR